MSELRKDPITGRWVIIATERSKRPTDFPRDPVETDSNHCPFCAGNESKTPPEIFAFRGPHTSPNQAGWLVRVVPNKFPALGIEGDLNREGVGLYDRMNGIGAHEVIIETPEHQLALEDQAVEGVVRVIETYRLRMTDLLLDKRFKYILIFKNVGRQAGASLSHPHSQLIATPVTPLRIHEKLIGAREYFEAKDRCVFEDILKQEVKEGVRLVYENAEFVSF